MKSKNSNGNELVLEKIVKLLYVVIGLVAVAIIIGVINTANISSISTTNNNNTTDNENEEEENTEYDVSMFNEVDYAGLKSLITSKGTHVIYIGRATCGYCVQFLPMMEEGQTEYGFKTNYFDISKVIDFSANTVIDQTAYDYIVGLDDYLKENFGATPMVLIFKDGKYVNGTVGYTDYATYEKFLTDNGISK